MKNIKVLVLDDSTTMLRIIVNTLKNIGIEETNIITSENGKEGFEKFTKNKNNLNLILTDWNMPIMNGLEFVNKVRNIDKDIKIVMITTESGKREVITALKAGVDNYIAKPFNAYLLREKLIPMLSK